MDHRTPKVSIGIPTYNRCTIIGPSLDSALGQTWHDIEVIVSDNASTDGTQTKLSEMRHARLTVLRQPVNCGMVPNWNACLEAASGDYFLLLSDDDVLRPDAIEAMMRAVANRLDMPLVVGLSEVFESIAGRTIEALRSSRLRTGVVDGTNLYEEIIAGKVSTMFCSVLFSREMLRRNGGFPLEFAFSADSGATLPLMLGNDIGFVNDICATYFVHSLSETNKLGLSTFIGDQIKRDAMVQELIDSRLSRRSDVRTLRKTTRANTDREIQTMAVNYLASRSIGKLEALAVIYRYSPYFLRSGKRLLVLFTLLAPASLVSRLRAWWQKRRMRTAGTR